MYPNCIQIPKFVPDGRGGRLVRLVERDRRRGRSRARAVAAARRGHGRLPPAGEKGEKAHGLQVTLPHDEDPLVHFEFVALRIVIVLLKERVEVGVEVGRICYHRTMSVLGCWELFRPLP